MPPKPPSDSQEAVADLVKQLQEMDCSKVRGFTFVVEQKDPDCFTHYSYSYSFGLSGYLDYFKTLLDEILWGDDGEAE